MQSMSDNALFDCHLVKRDLTHMPRPTLLLVEDNTTQQYVLKELCRRFDFELHVVGSGEEALDLLTDNQYDTILMDVRLPGIDGWECARTVRAMEKLNGRHTPIIGITAYAYDEDRYRCIDAGMDDYLAKPFEADALYQMLLRWAVPEQTTSATALLHGQEVDPAGAESS